MNKNYENVINKIQASENFKVQTINELANCRVEKDKRSSTIFFSIAACTLVLIGSFMDTVAPLDLRDRIQVKSQLISASALINFEGIIVDVSNNGLSFQLDTGQWVHIDDDTQIGVVAPNDTAKNNQFFEPTFRIGNKITGFTENKDEKIIYAYAVYTNWNWDIPIDD